jgi:hypothetical protein
MFAFLLSFNTQNLGLGRQSMSIDGILDRLISGRKGTGWPSPAYAGVIIKASAMKVDFIQAILAIS